MTEDPASDRWHVKYTFAVPVRGMVFSRNTNKFRASSWRATSGGKDLAWKEIVGREAVVVDDPRGAKTIELSFATDAKNKPSDYELNVAFTEGSRLLFTGHLKAAPIGCWSEPDCDNRDLAFDSRDYDPTAEARWTFRTAPKRGVLTLDNYGTGELTWRPTGPVASRGSYVYFGGLAPIETPHGRIVIDPGLPSWMRRSAADAIPKLVAWYTSETGISARSPLSFLSFGGGDRPGRNGGGGGLPGMVRFDAEGSGWLSETPEARREWIHLLGHELFHIWNGDMFTQKESADSWISEGSADYFAARALVAISETTSRELENALVAAANRCLLTLSHGFSLQPPMQGTPHYACGMTFFSWIDRAESKKKGTAGAVLGDVFARARAADSSQFSTADVLEAAARAGVDKLSLETIRSAVASGLPADSDTFFADRLGAMGISVDRIPVTKAEVGREQLLSAIGIHMARCDCEKRVALNGDEQTGILDFNDVPECNVLRGVRVVQVEGKSLAGDLGVAYQALADRKDLSAIRIRRDGAKQPETLRCREKTAPRFRRLLRLASGTKP